MDSTNKFYCSKKSTVYVTFPNPPIRFEVYDDRGKVYFFRELGGKFNNIKFNICHKGHYTTSDPVVINKIVDIEIIPITAELPPVDRARMKKISIRYNKDLVHTPARIFTKQGVIEIGPKYKSFPFPTRLFILCHEEGHLLYSNEQDADIFALKNYVNNGYNKSSAIYAMTKVLKPSKGNTERILQQFKNVQT